MKHVKEISQMKIRFIERQCLVHINTFWLALEQFRQNKGDLKAWSLLTHRLFYGREFAILYYEADTQAGMITAVAATEQIRVRFDSTGIWFANADEIETIRMGLQATEDMQKSANMFDQLKAYMQLEEIIEKHSKESK